MRQDVNRVIGEYIKMVEKIANGRTNILDFGEGKVYYRGEIHLIKMVGDNPGMHMSQIARHFNITRAVVSKTVAKLEKKGCLRREPDEADRKRMRLFLTSVGEEAYRAHEQYHNFYDGPLFLFLDGLGAQELAIIGKFMEKANQLVDNHF